MGIDNKDLFIPYPLSPPLQTEIFNDGVISIVWRGGNDLRGGASPLSLSHSPFMKKCESRGWRKIYYLIPPGPAL